MWKSKELLKKEAADLLFPVVERPEMYEVIKTFDVVITWNPESNEPIIGFLDAGDIKKLIEEKEI